MQIIVTRVTPEWLPNRAAEMTTHGQPVNAPMRAWYKSEHSPIRAEIWWIELIGIPTYVSVHLVRHKIGIEHFVESNREDRGGGDPEKIHRLTPVNHGMLVNSQALIAMSRKRLCYKADRRTVAVWRKLRKALPPELRYFMVPECVYRNGFCPEFSECRPGLKAVMAAYEKERKQNESR